MSHSLKSSRGLGVCIYRRLRGRRGRTTSIHLFSTYLSQADTEIIPHQPKPEQHQALVIRLVDRLLEELRRGMEVEGGARDRDTQV